MYSECTWILSNMLAFYCSLGTQNCFSDWLRWLTWQQSVYRNRRGGRKTTKKLTWRRRWNVDDANGIANEAHRDKKKSLQMYRERKPFDANKMSSRFCVELGSHKMHSKTEEEVLLLFVVGSDACTVFILK